MPTQQSNGKQQQESLAQMHRLQMHLSIPPALRAYEGLLELWMDKAVVPPLIENEERDSMLQVSLSLDGSRLTWQALHHELWAKPRFLDFLNESEVDQALTADIDLVCSHLKPIQFGTWVEVTADEANMGWYLPGSFPLWRVESLIRSRSQPPLWAWAKNAGIETIKLFGRSIAGGYPYTQLLFPLPPANMIEQLEVAQAAYEALQVGLMPPRAEAILRTLQRIDDRPLHLSVWLREEGPTKVSLLIDEPDLSTVLLLVELIGQKDSDWLAEFEGTLGVLEQDAVEVQQFASGFMSEVHYLL